MTPTPPTRRQIDEMTRRQSEAKAAESNLLRVTESTPVETVTAFIRSHGARGASGHFGSTNITWLLKPTAKGGPTLARVIVDDDADHIFEAAFAEALKPAPSAGTCITPSPGAEE